MAKTINLVASICKPRSTFVLSSLLLKTDFTFLSIAMLICNALLWNTLVVFASFFFATVSMASAFNLFAFICFGRCTSSKSSSFGQTDVWFFVNIRTIGFASASNFDTLWFAISSTISDCAIVIAFSWFISATVGWEGLITVVVAVAFNWNTFVVVTLAQWTAVGSLDTWLLHALLVFTKTFASIASIADISLLTGSVACTLNIFAVILCWIFLVDFFADLICYAVAVDSALYWDTSIFLTDLQRATCIM